uniref:uncharacterized protein LOC120328165 n=1 Tax=Styela clava TaxID=7725 RepID=UPI0019393E4C|nr:uncharacterized protein LOC120328165 [Styela clava]
MVEKKDHSSSSNPTTYYDLLASKVSQLAQKERNLLQFDNVNIRSAVATASAIIMNVALKRALVLYEGVIVTAVSVSITAIGSHFALDKLLVQSPMFSDPDFLHDMYYNSRRFSQAVSSTILPIATSLGSNAVIADR